MKSKGSPKAPVKADRKVQAKAAASKMTAREQADYREAAKRTLERRYPIAVKLGEDGELLKPEGQEAREAQFIRLSDTFGTASGNFMATVMGALRQSSYRRGSDEPCPVVLNASIAFVDAIRPENEVEAALAVQMANCHLLTTDMLGRAKGTDRIDHMQIYGNLAVKLQRTFTAQIEALGKLRGDANQSVRVEHVHVHEGGQAIVGNVHGSHAGGVRENDEDQSHAT